MFNQPIPGSYSILDEQISRAVASGLLERCCFYSKGDLFLIIFSREGDCYSK